MTGSDTIEHLLRVAPVSHVEDVLAAIERYGWNAALGMYATELELSECPWGTPLRSQLAGGGVRADWRDACPPKRGSAWEQLEFHRITTGATPTSDPVQELLVLLDGMTPAPVPRTDSNSET